jgi:hypothetical protein
MNSFEIYLVGSGIDYKHRTKVTKTYSVYYTMPANFTKAMLDKLGLTPAATTLQAVPPSLVRSSKVVFELVYCL